MPVAEFQKIKLRPIPKVKRRAPQPPVSLRLPKNVRQTEHIVILQAGCTNKSCFFILASFQTSSTTKTTTLTTPAKLYGKDLSEYDDVDVESLLAQLSPEEITILAKEVDPDVSSLCNDN